MYWTSILLLAAAMGFLGATNVKKLVRDSVNSKPTITSCETTLTLAIPSETPVMQPTTHFESTKNPEKIIFQSKKLYLNVWLAVNPETPIEKVLEFLNQVDGILFLGVRPGKEHQSFIPEVFNKIKFLRAARKKIKIQVDGGVNEKIAKKLAKLKVNFANSGSFVSDSENPKEAIRKLNQ